MNYFSKTFLIAVVSTTCILFPSQRSFSNEPVFAELPEDSSKGCAEAIDSVAAELSDGGFFVPWEENFGGRVLQFSPEVTTSADETQRRYRNYPMERPHSVTFKLSGQPARVDSLTSSPQLMSIFSARIMADCYQVGIVNFNHWWEGYVPIGYFPDNTARPFTYVNINRRERSYSEPLEWGTYFSL